MHDCTGRDEWGWVKSDLRQLVGRRKKEKRQLTTFEIAFNVLKHLWQLHPHLFCTPVS